MGVQVPPPTPVDLFVCRPGSAARAFSSCGEVECRFDAVARSVTESEGHAAAVGDIVQFGCEVLPDVQQFVDRHRSATDLVEVLPLFGEREWVDA